MALLVDGRGRGESGGGEHRVEPAAAGGEVLQLVREVVAGVVGLAGDDVLAAVSEVHGRGLGVPQASVPVTASRGRREPRGGLELEVDVGLVGGHQVLEGLDGLVVLENLHRGDVVRGDVARGDAVAALEQVHAVDGQPRYGLGLVDEQVHAVYGEARYGLGLVEYLPVVPDRDAGQLAEYVLDDQILLGTEGRDVVGYGVVALHLHLGGLDRHLVQFEGGLLHLEVVPPADIVYGAAHGLDAHAGDRDDHAVGSRADAEGVVPLSVGGVRRWWCSLWPPRPPSG